jgi:putative SOS response-associated peptidase YedK
MALTDTEIRRSKPGDKPYKLSDGGALHLMESIHTRMPVIIAQKDYERWMEPGEPSHPPVDLLKPYPARDMAAWKVGSAVGNVRNNRPELVEPLTS